ncbi:MAG: tRNA 2-thiouridine(34) synthase MnmA, partial [Dehalococcoidales bacterium]|nr:tRNA 2-thiouridine(34) synthase MnmA [Dehalococcoidales bacterium]
TMQIWPREVDSTTKTCCGLSAIEDARRVAYRLGIPHYVLNFRDIFAEKVIDNFCREYGLGRTPNPCIRCNRFIKFGALLEKARELGADFIATGHHARIETDNNGIPQLKKGADQHKDQSYFLYSLTREQLGHSLMPVGNHTKSEVREIAARLGLEVASKPGSQEICFIPDDNYAGFLEEHMPDTANPGPILDTEGHVLGEHRGIQFYTIGQRRGLHLAAGEPRYVVGIEPERNTIVIGRREDAFADELITSNLNWLTIDKLEHPITVSARVRYRHPEAKAEISPLDEDRVRVRFDEPQFAVTPGQAVVFYDGDIVVGGGTIERAERKWAVRGHALSGIRHA